MFVIIEESAMMKTVKMQVLVCVFFFTFDHYPSKTNYNSEQEQYKMQKNRQNMDRIATNCVNIETE